MGLVSYNLQHKSSRLQADLLLQFIERWPQHFIALQEVGAWSTTKIGNQAEFISPEGCDCGWVVPCFAASGIRRQGSGRYWCGIYMGSTIFLCAHLLHIHKSSGEDDEQEAVTAMNDMNSFMHACRFVHERADRALSIQTSFNIVLCLDANTTLPVNYAGVTGPHMLPPLVSHGASAARQVASWMDSWHLAALNTFFATDDLWTRRGPCLQASTRPLPHGKRRKTREVTYMQSGQAHASASNVPDSSLQHVESQIDYIAVSSHLDGTARAAQGVTNSDHRPVVGVVHLADSLAPPALKQHYRTGWMVADQDKQRFMQEMIHMRESMVDLKCLEQHVELVLRRTPHSTSALQAWMLRQADKQQLSEARAAWRGASSAEERQLLFQRYRKVRDKKHRARCSTALKGLSKHLHFSRHIPDTMVVDGLPSTDRRLWRRAAVDFGLQRFGNPDNNHKAQEDMLHKLLYATQLTCSEELPDVSLEFHQFMRALSAMRLNSAPGEDHIPVEVWQAVPWTLKILVWQLMVEYLHPYDPGGRDIVERAAPESWKQVAMCGLPKEKRRSSSWCFSDFRWISKSPVLQKIYVKSLMYHVEELMPASCVHTYGFKPHRCCDDVVGLIGECLHQSVAYRDRPIYVASLDIQTAFDDMDHQILLDIMVQSGFPFQLVWAVAREMLQLNARMEFGPFGVSDWFPLEKGGIQGGTHTPTLFNLMIEHALSRVVTSWKLADMGFKTCPGKSVSHAMWADNLWLLASSPSELQDMIVMATEAIYAVGFSWKPASLKVLQGTSCPCKTFEVPDPKGGVLRFELVDSLLVLGAALSWAEGSLCCLEHRLDAGDQVCHKHFSVFMGVRNSKQVITAWAASPRASVLYSASTWVITQALLVRSRRWEYKWLRKFCFNNRRRAGEGHSVFCQRTAGLIKKWMHELNVQPIHICILKRVFRGAWRERHVLVGTGDAPLDWVRNHLCAAEWAGIVLEPAWKRAKFGGPCHSRTGHIVQWEDVFVGAFGEPWRALRDAGSKSAWYGKEGYFINFWCRKWGLPGLGSCETHERQDIPAGPANHGEHMQLPEHVHHKHDDGWDQHASTFMVVTDNQLLADILMGRAELKQELVKPVWEELMRRLLILQLRGQLQPWVECMDPVQWRPRRYNVQSDALAGYTMNKKQSWCLDHGLQELRAFMHEVPVQVQILSDGGHRTELVSAAAFIVRLRLLRGASFDSLVNGQGSHFQPGEWYTVAMGGDYIQEDWSILHIEAWGMLLALRCVCSALDLD